MTLTAEDGVPQTPGEPITHLSLVGRLKGMCVMPIPCFIHPAGESPESPVPVCHPVMGLSHFQERAMSVKVTRTGKLSWSIALTGWHALLPFLIIGALAYLVGTA